MKSTLYQQINNKIKSIQSQQINIESFKEKTSQLDIDVQLATIRNLYDSYLQLSELNKTGTEADNVKPELYVPAPIEPVIEQGQKFEYIEPETRITIEPVIEPVVEKEVPQPVFTTEEHTVYNESENSTAPITEEQTTHAESPVVEEQQPEPAFTEPVAEKEIAEPQLEEEPIIEQYKAEIKPVEIKREDDLPEAKIQKEPVAETLPVAEEKIKEEEPEVSFSTMVDEEETSGTFNISPDRDEEIKPVAFVSEPVKHTHQSTINSNHPSNETLADKFKSEPSLYDKMTKGLRDKSLASKLQRKPIYDLRIAIGLNDKFEFINILFNGDGNAYAASIDAINKCTSLQEAEAYIASDLMSKYNWDVDNNQAHAFMELIERRFM